ncbi:MAG: hypothetical protein GY858_00710 [Candidatus Omnitrophica bacterium]|nr:hypothetical protein [Candidatus Omnitrophota bacterium]
MGKDKMVALRLSEVDKKQLEKDVKGEERTVSNLLLYCWKQWKKGKK